MRKLFGGTRDRDDRLELWWIVGVVFFLLWQLEKLLALPDAEYVSHFFDLVWVGMGALILYIARPQQDKPMRLLMYFLLWTALTSLIRGVGNLALTRNSLINAVLAYIVCYPLGVCIKEKRVDGLLRWLMCLWTVGVTVLSIAGLWATITGVNVWNFDGNYVLGMDRGEGRLQLFSYYTVAASTLSISAMLAVLGAVQSRHWWTRTLYALAALPMLACLALTDGRTGMVTLGFGLGVALCAGLVPMFKQRGMKPVPQVVACVLATLVLTAGTTLLLPLCGDAINAVSTPANRSYQLGDTTLIGTAGAEEVALPETEDTPDIILPTEDNVVRQKAVSRSFLSGREDVWSAVLKLFKSKPWLLATGTSVPLAMGYVEPYVVSRISSFTHVHCIYLQILLETGVVGLGLCLWFLWLFAKAAWQVMFRGERPLLRRLLPVPALMILLGETVECLTLPELFLPALPLLFVFLGLTMGEAKRDAAPADSSAA